MKIFTAGLEGSGNHWIRSVLRQHPQLEITGGDSYPMLAGPARQYPKFTEHDVMVVIVRDMTAHRLSVIASGYEQGNEGKFSDEESIKEIVKAIKQSPKVVFASYESALAFRQAYWDWLFQSIGVKPIEVFTDYKDANRKYFKELPPC